MAGLMSELLHHKAECCLDGQFIVEIPNGYDAVDQSVRVMAHVHHDEYDLVIMDPEMYPMVAGERNRSEGWEINRSMTRRNEEYERRSHGVANGISMEKIRKEIKKQEKRDGNGFFSTSYARPTITRKPEITELRASRQRNELEDTGRREPRTGCLKNRNSHDSERTRRNHFENRDKRTSISSTGYAGPEVTRRPEIWEPQLSSQNEEPEDVKSRSQPAEPEEVRSRRQPAGVLKKRDGVDDIRKIRRVLSRKNVHWD
jgi:hypothetical protein